VWYTSGMNKLPVHMSYSSLTTWLDCGWRYYLQKVEGCEERHSLWLTTGKAVHEALEVWDKNPGDPEIIWKEVYEANMSASIEQYGDVSGWDYKTKENPEWWEGEGVAMLERWIDFRSHGWSIHKDYIEREFNLPLGDASVKMALDRVMVDPDGKIVLIDIKTGASSQKHPLQLAVYAWALAKEDGLKVDKAGFWDARTAQISMWDIEYLHEERVEDIFNTFDTARKNNIFLPNLSACGRCGVVRYCKWINGKDAYNG